MEPSSVIFQKKENKTCELLIINYHESLKKIKKNCLVASCKICVQEWIFMK